MLKNKQKFFSYQHALKKKKNYNQIKNIFQCMYINIKYIKYKEIKIFISFNAWLEIKLNKRKKKKK